MIILTGPVEAMHTTAVSSAPFLRSGSGHCTLVFYFRVRAAAAQPMMPSRLFVRGTRTAFPV